MIIFVILIARIDAKKGSQEERKALLLLGLRPLRSPCNVHILCRLVVVVIDHREQSGNSSRRVDQQ